MRIYLEYTVYTWYSIHTVSLVLSSTSHVTCNVFNQAPPVMRAKYALSCSKCPTSEVSVVITSDESARCTITDGPDGHL